jgi:hypothetical protein
MKKSLLIVVVLLFAFVFIAFANDLGETLESHVGDIQRVIDLLNDHENEKAVELIDALYEKLLEVRVNIFDNVKEKTVVHLNNNTLENKVREILDKPEGDIFKEDLLMFANLDISFLKSLSGMEYFTNLRELDSSNGEIKNLKPLSGLSKLEVLWLGYNKIQDITPLKNLGELKKLYIFGNKIKDISPLRNLKKLETLDLDKNQFVIKDLSPLLELPNLKKLSVADCNIMDDTTIKKLKEKGVKVSQ